jgi:hypothetical protein
MPYDDPDPHDPMQLMGVGVPCDADTHREMASVFAEEFARLGYDRQKILGLFRNPFYAAAHRAFQALGEVEIERLVKEVAEVWSRVRITDRAPLEPRHTHEGELLWPRSTTGS